MRPDEQANEAQIERDQKFRRNMGRGLSAAASLVAAPALTGAASKIMPLLNKYVPVDLAIKGISKVSPKTGDFLKRGMSMGLTAESGLDFLKEQMETKNEPIKENRNIIEQYAPELHQFISDEIKQGRTPIEAAAMATLDKTGRKSFKNIIKKLTQDHKTPWSQIVESIYGSGQTAQPSQSPQQPTPTQQMQPQGQQAPLQAQPGQGQQALMSILQQINQKIGKA